MNLGRIRLLGIGCLLAALLPLFRVTLDPVNRPVLGAYSLSYTGLILLWWCVCAWACRAGRLSDPRRRLEFVFKTILVTFSLVVMLMVVELFLHARPALVPLSVRSRLAAGGAFLDFQGIPGAVQIAKVRYPSIPNLHDMMTEASGNLLSSIRAAKGAEPSGTAVYSRDTDWQGFCNPLSITGKVQCLVIGDSFAEMSHLPWGQRWPAQLAATRHWSLRNLGKGGISPSEGVEILKAFGAVHQPETVVFSIFEGNDPWDGETWVEWQKSGLPYTRYLVQKERFINRIILFKWYEDLMARMATPSVAPKGSGEIRMTFLGPFVDRLAISKAEMESFRGWRSVRDAVTEAKSWCDTHGAKLIIVLWPSREHLYALHAAKTGDAGLTLRLTGRSDAEQARARLQQIAANADAIHALMEETCSRSGVPLIWVMPPLVAALEQGTDPFFLDDIHPNRAGNKIVAEYLEERLR